ncbi:MAG: hypothetical protein KKE17_08820 [Proteobacteria bacterium]|nr:hypothetical protein [Pseudomonadota bacterium]MBU1710090.1 hypothetical protein [Pseudomonadota bacterium]
MPYPFKACLALCSDIDNCDLQTFIEIHKFINSTKHGLGLPVADSFFAVANDPRHLAFFNPDGSNRPKEAEFIIQAVRDGLIDSLHAWGDFNHGPPKPEFLQTIAKNLNSDFAHANLQIPIWINHGSPNNYQNLHARLWPEYQGDNPTSPYFTMPFIKELGIKYYWNSELSPWPLSTNHPGVKSKNLKRIAVNLLKNTAKQMLRRSSRIRTSQQLLDLTHETFLRDGSPMLAFNRFARHPDRQKLWDPTRHSLRYSLDKSVLSDLVKNQGYMIIYTHLAKPPALEDELFPPEDAKALKMLADFYQKGSIWVGTTAQILNFRLMQNYLDWNVQQKGTKIVIDIRQVNDPVTGPRIPDVNELAGVCFNTPSPAETIIHMQGKALNAMIFNNDNNGSGVIGFNIPPAPRTDLVDN